MRSLFVASLLVAGLGFSSSLLAQDSTSIKLTADEKRILELVNAARKKVNLPPLLLNAKLMKSARDHAANMASQKKMSHTLDGKTPFDRIKAVEYRYRTAGENVASGSDLVTVDEIFEGWMQSDGHRANILSADYHEIGIGIGAASDGRYYAQVFAKPR